MISFSPTLCVPSPALRATSPRGVQTGDILDTCSGTSLTLFRHVSINYRRIAMPWRETTKMSQKLEFITRLQHYDGNFSQLCEAFGISRTTGYKWRHRHADKGEAGLHELSRRPQCSPTITPAPIQQQVLAVRELHPTWGGRKIHWSLKHQDCQQVPAASTITAILRRTGRLSPNTPTPAVRAF